MNYCPVCNTYWVVGTIHYCVKAAKPHYEKPTKSQLNIGLDMDEVIVDFLGPMLRWFNLTIEDITHHNFSENPETAPLAEAFLVEGYFSRLAPYPDALEFIKELKQLGNVWLISSPSSLACSWVEKAEWVAWYLPDLANRLILTRNKDACVFDFMIDDHIKNLMNNRSTHRLLFDRPWNRETTSGLCRVFNYEDVLCTIKGEIDVDYRSIG